MSKRLSLENQAEMTTWSTYAVPCSVCRRGLVWTRMHPADPRIMKMVCSVACKEDPDRIVRQERPTVQEVYEHPAPLCPATEVHIDSWYAPPGCKTLAKLALKCGWKVTMTYAKGTKLIRRGQVLSSGKVVTSYAVRITGQHHAAVAVYEDGRYEFGCIIDELRPIGANDLKRWLKETT